MHVELDGIGILSGQKERARRRRPGASPFLFLGGFGGWMGLRTKVTVKKTKKTVGVVEEALPVALTPLRPSQCRAYMRRELAREFRGIVKGFVDGAKKGSCQHVKLATELVGAPERKPKRGKSVIRELIDEMESRPV